MRQFIRSAGKATRCHDHGVCRFELLLHPTEATYDLYSYFSIGRPFLTLNDPVALNTAADTTKPDDVIASIPRLRRQLHIPAVFTQNIANQLLELAWTEAMESVWIAAK